jgi:hypothetical protein
MQPSSMVWRGTAPTRARAAADAVAPDGAVRRQQPPRTPETPPVAASRARPPATSASTALDPALLDRLAEDVMQRLDRRLRIERERRGL